MKRKPACKTRPAAIPRRLQDWPTRLFAFIEERRSMPFAWGVHDCCLFACDGIRSQTGLDPAAKSFRGKYSGMAGAVRLVRKHNGVEAIAATTCAALGFAELAGPRLAQRGDVVLMDIADGMKCALGICVGADAAFVGPAGLHFVPVAQCRRAWRVTHAEGGLA